MASVKALKYHTHAGEEHQAGDVYEVDDADVANLKAQGMAVPVDEAPPEKPEEPK